MERNPVGARCVLATSPEGFHNEARSYNPSNCIDSREDRVFTNRADPAPARLAIGDAATGWL